MSREMDWSRAKKRYENHPVYEMTMFQLSDEKLESLDAVEGIEGESKLSAEARERIVLEITMRVLTLTKIEVRAARREEAENAVTSIESASSLAEARAKAIWHQRNLH